MYISTVCVCMCMLLIYKGLWTWECKTGKEHCFCWLQSLYIESASFSPYSYSDQTADLNNYVVFCFLFFFLFLFFPVLQHFKKIVFYLHCITFFCFVLSLGISFSYDALESLHSPQLGTAEVTRKSKQGYLSLTYWRNNTSFFYRLQHILWEPLFCMHQNLHWGRDHLGKQLLTLFIHEAFENSKHPESWLEVLLWGSLRDPGKDTHSESLLGFKTSQMSSLWITALQLFLEEFWTIPAPKYHKNYCHSDRYSTALRIALQRQQITAGMGKHRKAESNEPKY